MIPPLTLDDPVLRDDAELVRRAKAWVPHGPEDRLSIVVDRFLNDALAPPFYAVAIPDEDAGQRTDRQRSRHADRGQHPGQLDWDVWQGHWNSIAMVPHARKLELKRGKNDLSPNQRTTAKKLAALGAPPVVAWTLREVHDGLRGVGFRFVGNVETLLQKYEAELDALDRRAELTLVGGVAPKKKSRTARATPRYTGGKGFVRRASKAGIGV